MRIRTKAAALAVTVVVILVGATGAGAITNGQPDEGAHPYVGLLVTIDLDAGLASACSGSLLSSSVFLTAGHCTDGAELAFVWFDESIPTNPLFLSTADAIGLPNTSPDFCLQCGKGLPGFARGDIGIVQLLATPGSVPTEYASLPVAGAVDSLKNKSPIDFVGFGVTFQAQIPGSQLPQPPPFYRWDGLGTRMFAPSETVSGSFKHSAEFMKLAMNAGGGSGGTCFGDSGGPVLGGGTDTVLAVNSYGTNSNCSGVGYSQRIDTPDALSWIRSFLN